MKQLKTALFDFDGVVVDTEPIYDLFWNDAAKRYGLGIDNFADIIKGTTLPYEVPRSISLPVKRYGIPESITCTEPVTVSAIA